METGNLWDALRDGNPGVIIDLTLLALVAAVGIWRYSRRRFIPIEPGRLDVTAIHAHLAKEAARRAEFERNAVREAARTITVADATTEISGPRTRHLADDGECTFVDKIGAANHPAVVPKQASHEFVANAYKTSSQLRLSTEKPGGGK